MRGPADPPALSHEAALALLRLLVRASDKLPAVGAEGPPELADGVGVGTGVGPAGDELLGPR